MPEPTLTRQEFAASIKAKYPDYASVPDEELVDRMLTKYPVYRERIVDFKSTNDTASDEPAFRTWYADAAKQYDLNPNPEGQHYDYRAAFRAGAKPDASGHWPSDYKQPGHPTMVVGGFHVQTGERVPGTKRANESELVKLGWDAATAKKLAATPEPSSLARTAGDVVTGAVKGLGSTVFGLGKMVHDYTPIGRISDAIQPGAFVSKPPELEPTNTPQKIGYGVEQIGEFFIPGGAVSRAGKAVQAAGHTMAQTGSPATAGVSGALTAVLPGAGAAARASQGLKGSAEKSVTQALGATKEWAKSEAATLAPEILKRGIGGSRKAMLETAKAKAKEAGANLNAMYAQAAQAGIVVPGQVIRQSIAEASAALKVPNAQGVASVIPGTERVIRKLDKLDEFVSTLGDDIPIDHAAHVKRVWDGIVSKAGLFGPKATASATDSADAWAIREASNSFRKILNSDPSIAALNAESAFWTGLKNVLRETEKRTQAQSYGLVAAGTGGAGAIVGAVTGDSASDKAQKAILGGLAGRQLVRVIQSPAFRTKVSAPLKNALADALAWGQTTKATEILSKITAAMPAQVRAATAQ